MSDVTTGQVPVIVELGGKVVRNLFLGGYLGIAGGMAAGSLDDRCDDADYDCYALGIRAGNALIAALALWLSRRVDAMYLKPNFSFICLKMSL